MVCENMNRKIMYTALFFISLILCQSCSDVSCDPVDYVNPFIGTAGGGNTFPGAVVPLSLIHI